ncbi:glycosyltransferase family 1 protein [Nocardioides albidus]|uniref:Glycosyltransferase family 1 protein n=1 Tax=Nocardioides albidus TaxID=1517589 RepID=A0A5C4WPC6_9ACTN|nr:glycosyltransferase family 1 protein [Nocardioides albidus]TNM50127.1 glycosyltransferase family 1 protein [Nocardioides albidus]
MKVAIVTESFLPLVNGVVNSVRQVVDRLLDSGHEPLVIAPGPGPEVYRGVRVVRVRSVAVPRYPSFPLGLPDRQVEDVLARFAPDVVHLASPIVLGWTGLRAARRRDLPTVAVYQTDIPGYLRQYGLPGEAACARWVARLHRRATRTLVPSRAAYDQLDGLGVGGLHLWGRGVDLGLFDPGARSAELRRRWEADGATVVGYVGRLAAEKQVRRLADLADVPGIRLVVVGDGPEAPYLRQRLPDATFTGMLTGPDLAAAFASLDVFVHTGLNETFCQTIQEAQASGVAVVAPAIGGPLDLVEHGRTGLLYDAHDPAALRTAVEGLATDGSLRAALAANGLSRVADRSWARVVDELVERHYRGAIADHAGRLAA